MSKTVNFSQMSHEVMELSCNNGIIESLIIHEIPMSLRDKVSQIQAENNLCVPEEFKRFFSMDFSVTKNDEETFSLRIRIRFLSCAFLCAKLKQSYFNLVLFDKQIHIKHECSQRNNQETKQSMISVDLGNTRTCAVVCPDINSISMEKLFLTPHYSKESKVTTSGVWDSVCVTGQSMVFKDTSPSFVRIGNEYEDYLREYTKTSSNYLRSLSSPKRYFWDNEADHDWAFIIPGAKSDETYSLKDLDIELAKAIAEDSYAGNYPKAMILEATIYELLEQAERMLNKHYIFGSSDKDEIRDWHNQPYYQISHFVMTFPAAWSSAEVEAYRRIIQRGIDHFVSQRCNGHKIELHLECNEATAVLVNYIYSESQRFGRQDRWLKLAGKADSVNKSIDHRLRLCVIDIGGGTSDLAIAELKWDSIAQAIKIETCYTYGTNEAGDALIAKIIKDFIFDKVFDKIVGDTLKGKRRDLLRTHVVRNILPKLKQFTREFWFKLALNYLDLVETETEPKIVLFDKDKVTSPYNVLFKNLLNAIKTILEEDGEKDEQLRNMDHYILDYDAKNAEITFSAKENEQYRELLRENFRYSPIIFGSAISSYQCDLVIWSGKTSENKGIRELFEKQIAIPPSSFLSMNDYKIQKDRFPLTGLDGKLTDSKYATAIGAALYALLKINRNQYFSFTVHNVKSTCYWGLVDERGIFDSYLSPTDTESSPLMYNGNQGLLIYRSNSNSSLAFSMPAYEFRSKPGTNINITGAIQFQLRQTNDGILDFDLLGGQFSLEDGTPVDINSPGARDYFELRLRMSDKEEFWLDTGEFY